jgi:Zn-dependent alcohol dehydrogenase
MSMRAVVASEPGKLDVMDIVAPGVGPYQALVKTEVAALCNATDSKLLSGNFPGVNTFPMVLGHEGAGIVEQVGAKVRNFKIGDRAIGGLVFQFAESNLASAWGGFCEYTLVNDHDAMVADGVADAEHGWFECYEIQRAVDPDIPVEAAALLCTWREVYGGFGDFRLKAGDRILVYGAGPVGLSFVKIGKLLGLDYIAVVDPLELKRRKALEMGADAAFSSDADLAKEFGGSLDAVVDAVGKPAIIEAAVKLIRLGGSVCVYGVLSESSFTVNKSEGPFNFNLFIHQWPTRRREREAQGPLCDWIREGKLRADEFVTHTFDVADVGKALAKVKDGEAVKVLLRY